MISRLLCAALASVALSSCVETPEATIVTTRAPLIVDELHNAGTVGFVFLPPVVPRPAVPGDCVPDLPVTVRVDRLDTDGRPEATVATFTHDGPRGSDVRFREADSQPDPELDDGDADPIAHYVARWRTRSADLSLAAIYRVHVLVPGADGEPRVLGFTDVDVVPDRRSFRAVDRDEYTPLVDGDILRIKFRIDRPAVDADGDGTFDWLDPYDDRTPRLTSIRGDVRVSVAGRRVRARDVLVWLAEVGGTRTSERVATDLFGTWSLGGARAELAPGTWIVCSEAKGLERWCDTSQPFEVTGRGALVAPDHLRVAPPGTVAARVALADGSPCAWSYPLHDVEVFAAASAGGQTALANHAGELLLFGAKENDIVSVRCEAEATSVAATPGSWQEIVLTNRRPDARGLLVVGVDGPVDHLSDELVATVEAVAIDPDGDRLSGHWADNRGPLAERGLSITWARRSDGPNLEVLVGDGRGGYDLATLALPFDPPPPPSGLVLGPDDEPIAGATVRQGERVIGVPDEGGFVLADWRSEVPLVASAPGFVDRVRTLGQRPRGEAMALRACERVTFDAAAGATLALPSDPSALVVEIARGSVLGPDRLPYAGPAEACLAVIDARLDHPLGLVVGDGAGDRVIAPTRSAWVDLYSADAARLPLGLAKPAVVTLALARDEVARFGSRSAYAYRDGAWRASGAPFVRDGRATVPLVEPGAITAGPDEAAGCVRLWLDGLRHRASSLALRYQVLGTPAGPRVTVPLTPSLEVLWPLPARTEVRIEVLDLDLPTHPPIAEWTTVVRTGDTSLTPLEAHRFPHDLCGADLVLPPPGPLTGVDLLSRQRLVRTRTSWGQVVSPTELAQAYYRTFDPYGSATDWWVWMGRAGLTDGGGSGTLINASAPGLARRRFDSEKPRVAQGRVVASGATSFMLMEEPAWNDAVYFASNPAPLGHPDLVLGLEVIPTPAGRYALFNAFVGAFRVSFVDLDGSGLKAAPAVCLNCHGGSIGDPVALADHVAMTGRWPSLDLGASAIPFALDTLKFHSGPPTSSAPFTRTGMEDEYRRLNELVLGSLVAPSGRALILGAYGAAPHATTLPAGATYDDTWVPPGSDADGWSQDPGLYRDVVARYCRSCHMQTGPDLATRDGLLALADLIEDDVCQSRSMPHALTVASRFWTSTLPYAPGRLEAGLVGAPGWSGLGCDPP